jgi:predicted nucleotidyltransferase
MAGMLGLHGLSPPNLDPRCNPNPGSRSMSASPDDLAAVAACAFAHALSAQWQARLGNELLGIYLLGSLAHGGFSRRYSDIDLAVVTETGLAAATLDDLRSAAVARSADLGPKVSIFWTDRHFAVGRFPPLDRADYLDHAMTLYERERVEPTRPTLAEVRAYLSGAPFANWAHGAHAFATSDALAPQDRKSYVRALLYPARFIMSFMTGRMASNDEAVARLADWALPGLDTDLIRRALACRRAAANPDGLFPARRLLPNQVMALKQFAVESEAEQP